MVHRGEHQCGLWPATDDTASEAGHTGRVGGIIRWLRAVSRWVPLAAAVAAGVGTVWIASSRETAVSYAQASEVLAALSVLAGFALVVAGAVLLLNRPGSASGTVAGIAALGWFASQWVGWTVSPALLRSLAEPLAVLWVPAVFQLVASHPGGRLAARPARVAAQLLFGAVALTAVTLALFRNPYNEHCLANCSTDVFLVRPLDRVADAAGWTQAVLQAGGCAGVVLMASSRVLSGTPRSRVWQAPMAVPAVAFGVAQLWRLIEIERAGLEDPYDRALHAPYAVVAASLVLMAAASVGAVLRSARIRAAVGGVAHDLGSAPEPGSVETALRSAVGDGSLRIGYRVPGSGRHVDAQGREVQTSDAAELGVTTTRVVRNDETIATVTCTEDAAEHLRELGPALVLGIENERLQAGLLAQLHDLRLSRSRIVDTADAARARLERDLHDGAQQHLLALSFDVRLAHASAIADGDAVTAVHLEQAGSLAQQALGELRDLAQGIFPVVLASKGLGAALTTLAETAPLAVTIETPVETSGLDQSVASAAFFAARTALDDAAARGADIATVRTSRRGGLLTLRIDDNGKPRRGELLSVADRVGALGGSLAHEPRTCEVTIPCA
jgi:signal transduction histidine kinase